VVQGRAFGTALAGKLRAEEDVARYVDKISEHITDLPVDQREARLVNPIIALSADHDEMAYSTEIVLLVSGLHRENVTNSSLNS